MPVVDLAIPKAQAQIFRWDHLYFTTLIPFLSSFYLLHLFLRAIPLYIIYIQVCNSSFLPLLFCGHQTYSVVARSRPSLKKYLKANHKNLASSDAVFDTQEELWVFDGFLPPYKMNPDLIRPNETHGQAFPATRQCWEGIVCSRAVGATYEGIGMLGDVGQ